MQLNQPKTIYLKDYRPSPFKIDTIFLSVDIFSDVTKIKSKLHILKESSLKGQSAHLELNGENLKFKSISIDGRVLNNDEFQLSSDKLVVFNLSSEAMVVEIENDIDPLNNKSCEGFYKSGDQYCTQCEPEGFRKITYFIDRPDVMAKYRTRMTADKKVFPFLLSNGNRVAFGDLADGRHFVEWEDPFRKPSYLFAMVAGDFDVARDTFVTKSKRKIDLEIYVDKGNLKKTSHAMDSLKKAMKWDEEAFGLEYDLDIYMIVAVDSFNMGAMENKGLNIFNSTYTLADKASATDHDFQNIQGVIGHEYFHNWTGNRITCRDWFQLTLKEGLTVYRDQEFSSDMLSRSVKRLEDVRLLKEGQFPEDAGPLSHPIRPGSYIEINNFYTRTIYEKGAEVIRMIETLIGKEKFRKGMDKYFELFDGQAVTTENFIHAMEVASGKSLTQFQNWYSRPGTPRLKIQSHFEQGVLSLQIQQVYPPTTHKVPEGNVLHMPFKLAFMFSDATLQEQMIELTKLNETFTFSLPEMPILSLNRGFSAPVHVDYEYKVSDLFRLMAHDTDAYCKFEATQKIYEYILKEELEYLKLKGTLKEGFSEDFKSGVMNILKDQKLDHSFKSYLLDLPSENTLAQEIETPSFEAIHKVHRHVQAKMGSFFQGTLIEMYDQFKSSNDFELSPKGYGERSLKNQTLNYLVAGKSNAGFERLENHYNSASNMTEEIFALVQFIKSGHSLDHFAIQNFYQKWKHDSLVMLKWFGALASYSPATGVIERMKTLENDPLFLKDVPNYLRALYGQFARNNLSSFHATDGSGYEFVTERILKIDQFNPQVASRLASSFSMINRLDTERKKAMKTQLEKIIHGNPSRDTYEVVSKYLAQ